VLGLPTPDGLVVIASNYGQQRHPAWYYNLRANPAGEIAVDLKTLDTGIGLRNEHMRTQYLEVGKGQGFDTAALSDVHLLDLGGDAGQGRTRFTGTLLLHGTKRPIAGQADIRREGAAARVDASFPVVPAEYGIASPRYLGVGVKDAVQVKVSLTAAPAASSGSR